jgi:hypothetical protein
MCDDALAFKDYEIEEQQQIRKRLSWILHKSNRNWFVSPELARAYGFTADNECVLLPIPEGRREKATWRSQFAGRPVLAYAGYIYTQQFPLLRRLGKIIHDAGGQLMIVSNETTEIQNLCSESMFEFYPLLPTNDEALEFVRDRASAFLAAYCEHIEEMPWIESSFPSKVVEFAHLGIPILLVSPPESAVYGWGQRRKLTYNLRPNQSDEVTEFVKALKDPIEWRALAEPIQRLADGEFNPEHIQLRLEEHLI